MLDETRMEKDLGVIINDILKFHVQTAAAFKKANQILGILKKTFKTRDPKSICALYKAMVRPHLEYGNAIWGPFYQMDILKIESVQRRATKLVHEIRDLTYEERLMNLEIPSLAYRRKKGDMILMYKIMNRLIKIDNTKLFLGIRATEPEVTQ